MAKRDLPNGSQTVAKRRRTQDEQMGVFDDDIDEEQRAYNNEIREHDQQHGSEMIPRPSLDICEKTGYRPGSILQIYMKNVMSYDECLVNFGPTLNFVIGPNGSGKSTMLAAICLAFAAPITCMGKAALKAQQLIKSTKDALEVRVVVKNFAGMPDLTFKRTLTRDEKQGKFFINGKSATMKEVRATARELDIQIVSMTRFLPQDRVKDFTTMSPKELLITTMEDVGYKNMRSHYDSLVNQQEHSADDEHRLQLATDALADLDRRRNDLTDKIAQLEEREKQEEMVKKLEKVAVYSKGIFLKQETERIKVEVAQLNAANKDLIEEKETLSEKMGSYQQVIKTCGNEMSQKEEKAKQYWRKYRELRNKDKEIAGKMAKHEGDFEAAQRRLDKHEEETKVLQNKVQEDQASYTALCKELDDPAFQERKEGLKAKLAELDKDYSEAKQVMRDLEAKRRNESGKADEIHSALESERRVNDRFVPVQRINMNLIQKVKRIAPPDQFRYSLPAINTVRLKQNNLDDQRMVSAVVRTTAQHFVARDSSAAAQIVRVEDKITVREVSKSFEEASHTVPVAREQLRGFGFDGYILDLVEGPDHNLAHLCETAKIHAVPYSRQGLTTEQISKLPPSINRFISKNMLYTVKQSRYGQRYTSTKSEPIDTYPPKKDSQIIYEKLPDRSREQELQEQYDELVQRLRPLKEEVKTANSLLQDKAHLKNETADELRRYRTRESKKDILAKNLHTAKVKLKKHVENAPAGIEEVKALIAKKRNETRDEIAANMLDRVKVIKKLGQIIPDAQKDAIALARANVLVSSLKTRYAEVEAERAQFKEKFQRLKERYKAAKAEYEAYMANKEEVEPEYVVFFEELKAQYDGPDLQAHVDAQIDALRQELTFANVDMDARNKYEEVLRQAERTKQEVVYLTNKRDNAAEEMQKIIDVFVPELERIVNLVSSRFAELLKKKEKASGLVVLRTVKEKANPNDPSPEEPLPFSQWGIEIMVSFREGGNKCKLDGTTQSGGERSISIGTYLLALQGVAPVAFRALDEINQALDAKNEVIMNQHVADTAADFDQQLFLLSPKLIHFNYPKKMRILTICNGSGVATKGATGGSFLALKHLQHVFSE
ncbi:YALIA101S13e01134g1_1 [Yarrowia lipolytica]|nr:YALIA101S13e01134g1_1 [Yarrowia lipolytica]VBB78560.1 Conserved hypothetical protein [Yarrowia lipolytica]